MSRGKIRLRPLSARAQLEAPRRAATLLPYLLKQGLEPEDAMALAANACLLHSALADGPPTPFGVLKMFSVLQIAQLCEALEDGAQPLEWEIEEGGGV